MIGNVAACNLSQTRKYYCDKFSCLNSCRLTTTVAVYILDTYHNICDCVTTVFAVNHRHGLGSDHILAYDKPRTRAKFGERSFTFYGLAAWNSLPGFIKRSTDIDAFKKTS